MTRADVLVVVAAAAAMAGLAKADQVKLVEDGVAKCRIAVADDATSPEKFGAEELAKYLRISAAAEIQVEGGRVKVEGGGGGGVAALPSERDLLDEDDVTGMDRIKFSEDVSNLIAEEKAETSEAAPFGKTVKREKAKPVQEALPEPPHEARPKEYVVEEGDTLFKLAMRFYGRRSAWTLIRDANKAVVSPDGRIRQGQKLVLP